MLNRPQCSLWPLYFLFVITICILCSTSPVRCQDMESNTFFANQAAAEYERQGITLQPQAIRDLKWFETYQKQTKDLYHQLGKYQKDYQAEGNTAKVQQITQERKKLLSIVRNVPQYKPSLSFLLNLHNYKGGNQFHRGNNWIKSIKAEIPAYEKEIEANRGKTGNTGNKPQSGSVSGNQPVASNLEVYIISKSGKIDFYVNGVKVEHAHQTFPLNGKGSFVLKAVGIGEKRKYARELIAPSNTTIDEQNDYALHYTTSYGNFKGSTNWDVVKDVYQWSVTKEPNAHGDVDYKTSSTSHGLSNDEAVFTFSGAFTYGANVSANTTWKGVSQRPGGARTSEVTDKASGSIMLWVSPKS